MKRCQMGLRGTLELVRRSKHPERAGSARSAYQPSPGVRIVRTETRPGKFNGRPSKLGSATPILPCVETPSPSPSPSFEPVIGRDTLVTALPEGQIPSSRLIPAVSTSCFVQPESKLCPPAAGPQPVQASKVLSLPTCKVLRYLSNQCRHVHHFPPLRALFRAAPDCLS
jgi:hypothetical protein